MHCLAWSCNGSHIAAGLAGKRVTTEDHDGTAKHHMLGTVQVWHPETLTLTLTLIEQVWHPETQTIAAELPGHTGIVSALGWKRGSSSGLASASTDGTLRVWDVREHAPREERSPSPPKRNPSPEPHGEENPQKEAAGGGQDGEQPVRRSEKDQAKKEKEDVWLAKLTPDLAAEMIEAHDELSFAEKERDQP